MTTFRDLTPKSLIAWIKADDAAWLTADADEILSDLELMEPAAAMIFLPAGLNPDGSQKFGYPRRTDIISYISERYLTGVYMGPPRERYLQLIDRALNGESRARRDLMRAVLAVTQYIEALGIRLIVADGTGSWGPIAADPNRWARQSLWWNVLEYIGCDVGCEPCGDLFGLVGGPLGVPSVTLESTVANLPAMPEQIHEPCPMYLANVHRHDAPDAITHMVDMARRGWVPTMPPWVAKFHGMTGPKWAEMMGDGVTA